MAGLHQPGDTFLHRMPVGAKVLGLAVLSLAIVVVRDVRTAPVFLVALLAYIVSLFYTFMVGNPPKKVITRVIRAQIKLGAPVKFLAHYDMNNCTPETRAAFIAKVRKEMENF